MEVTTQDVLNLATAFEKLQANRSLGNGCVVSSGKINKILYAIERATDTYLSQLTQIDNERMINNNYR